ncbi:MAG TPA: pyridoxamine 5'-phosphate oxidase family protein [Nitrososphaerales archaeon]|nr:pyridoxamine 5'-phosphate oxidase family protein [Nitrososphaerales archaeon]
MPRRIRPKFPKEWNVPNNPKLWVTWASAEGKLAKEDVYWVSTSSRDGKPHAAPVWGIWKGLRLYFETDPMSVKGKNLLANPRVVVHIQDGMDTVIVEGTARRLTKAGEMSQLRREYVKKYDYEPDWSDDAKQVVFEVSPKIAHAWHAPKMHRSLVNFIF